MLPLSRSSVSRPHAAPAAKTGAAPPVTAESSSKVMSTDFRNSSVRPVTLSSANRDHRRTVRSVGGPHLLDQAVLSARSGARMHHPNDKSKTNRMHTPLHATAHTQAKHTHIHTHTNNEHMCCANTHSCMHASRHAGMPTYKHACRQVCMRRQTNKVFANKPTHAQRTKHVCKQTCK